MARVCTLFFNNLLTCAAGDMPGRDRTESNMYGSLAELQRAQCRPLRGAEHRLSDSAIDAHLSLLPGWERSNGQISRTWRFDNFQQTMAFVNAVADLANREDHHPDLEVSYGRCKVSFNTHDVDGISENDFVCAAKVDMLAAR